MQNTTINSVAKGLGVITAQAREKVDDVSGFTFIYCKIIGTGDTYLGRAWRKMPRVVFAFTEMGTLINSKGWSNTASGQAKQYAPIPSSFSPFTLACIYIRRK
jgi:pectinesterase